MTNPSIESGQRYRFNRKDSETFVIERTGEKIKLTAELRPTYIMEMSAGRFAGWLAAGAIKRIDAPTPAKGGPTRRATLRRVAWNG